MGAGFSKPVQYSILPCFPDASGASEIAQILTLSPVASSFSAYVERATPILPMLCLTGCRVRRSRFSVFLLQPIQGLPQGPIMKGRSITLMGLEPAVVSDALTTNPVELRARRGRCRFGPPATFTCLTHKGATPGISASWSLFAMSSVKTQPKIRDKAKLASAPRPRDQQQPRFVGIDLHKETATFHILSHDGASLKSGSFRR